MEEVKAQLANRLKEANNVLVTVTNNPSVDQLAAAIGLTLVLNKLGKHATTVFSGAVPSTIQFLQPEKTIEKNTDSLRDFIISLDKAKADKLRYKIEDTYVKIFITPYHSSIGEKDLVFSQGDFNVDVVVGLGVHQREELDQAITAHGRILHDATVATINTQPPSNLGSLNWSDPKSSSLCEMLVTLADMFGKQNLFDAQISNALLTGIVAETQRFSNQKTSSNTMSASAKLLGAGANQQLVATQLTPKPLPPPPPPAPTPTQKPPQPPAGKPADGEKSDDKPSEEAKPPKESSPPPLKTNEDGTLQIDHGGEKLDDQPTVSEVTQVLIDDQGTLQTLKDDVAKANSGDAAAALASEKAENDANKDTNKDAKEGDAQPPEDKPGDDQSPPPPLPTAPSNLPEPVPFAQSEQPSILPPPPPPLEPLPPPPPLAPPQQVINPPLPPTTELPKAEEESNSMPFLGAPKLVMQPPSMSVPMNQGSPGNESETFVDPLSSAPPAPVTPLDQPALLSHDLANNAPSAYQPSPYTPLQSQLPPMPAVQTPSSNMPNLNDVRNAVDAALSNAPPSIANQPLASLGAQPLPNPSQNLPPGIEMGSSIQPEIIAPGANGLSAPPVPPPIVQPPDLSDDSLPPAMTAL